MYNNFDDDDDIAIDEMDELIDTIISRLAEMTIGELRQTDMYTESLIA